VPRTRLGGQLARSVSKRNLFADRHPRLSLRSCTNQRFSRRMKSNGRTGPSHRAIFGKKIVFLRHTYGPPPTAACTFISLSGEPSCSTVKMCSPCLFMSGDDCIFEVKRLPSKPRNDLSLSGLPARAPCVDAFQRSNSFRWQAAHDSDPRSPQIAASGCGRLRNRSSASCPRRCGTEK